MSVKSYFVVSALAIAAAGNAFAIEGTQEFTNQVLSTKSRAEVVAELRAAQAAGLIESGEASRAPLAVSTLPRAQVVAETREALRLGLIAPSEVQVIPTAAQLEAVRSAGERALAPNVAAVR